MTKKKDLVKFQWTGIGLIFGTAIGAGLSIAFTQNILWAGIGTAVGLIVGAIIDTIIRKQQ
jgi:NhaP-type Na+/H+ or K+/H+ antiporter